VQANGLKCRCGDEKPVGQIWHEVRPKLALYSWNRLTNELELSKAVKKLALLAVTEPATDANPIGLACVRLGPASLALARTRSQQSFRVWDLKQQAAQSAASSQEMASNLQAKEP
jgi:hypothetical protein